MRAKKEVCFYFKGRESLIVLSDLIIFLLLNLIISQNESIFAK